MRIFVGSTRPLKFFFAAELIKELEEKVERCIGAAEYRDELRIAEEKAARHGRLGVILGVAGLAIGLVGIVIGVLGQLH